MSTQYNGIPGNLAGLVPEAALTISSSTNTSPIVVTTSAPHGLNPGDAVIVYGHKVNLGANGAWSVAVPSPTTLTLIGSIGIGIGGAFGIVQPATDGPTYPITSDGDDFTAAAFNGAYEALGDRTAFQVLYTLGLVEWSMLKRNPVGVAFSGGAAQLNIEQGSNFQVAAQGVGSTITLAIASYPPLHGMTMTITISPDNTNPINIQNEGAGGAIAIFHGGGGTIKMRFDGVAVLWKVIESSYSFGSTFVAGTNYLTLNNPY